MLDSARRRFATDADRIVGGARRLGLGRPWRGIRRARLRVLATLAPADRSVAVRNLVTLLGGIIVLITALSIPIGYGCIGYLKEAEALTYKAELSAARAAQYIYAPDSPWKYDTDQLAAMSEIRTTTAAPIVQRILNAQGASMMQKGDRLPWPTFARRAPIFAAGTLVGSAEVSASLRPLLAEVAGVGFLALVLAVAAYFAFALLPLGALDRTLAELETANDKFRRQNKLLKQREEELEAQNTRFDAAIHNMSQGLCLFDAEQRVVFANRRFAEMYTLDPEQVKPGTTLRQILEARAAKGAYGDIDTAGLVDEGVATFGQEVSQIVHLADDRFISVLRRPMPDGGLVSTHDDITEREALNERLAHQNELLKQREEELEIQNKRFNAAINNMSQGLCLYDAEQRVMFANRRFAEIYRLDPDQVKPGTTLRRDHPGPRRQRCLRQHRRRRARRRWGCTLRPGALAGRPPRGRTFHLHPASADAGWRRGHHARGRHRARDAQGPSRAAERAARRRHEQHVPGLGHVRRRAPARHMQQGLRRHVRPDVRNRSGPE